MPLSWYDGLARILTKVEDVGVWPDGLLDAYIAMIPKADGDATPLGQRPLTVFSLLFIVFGLLPVCLSWMVGSGLGYLRQSSVLVVVVVRKRLGTISAKIITVLTRYRPIVLELI